MLSQRADFVKIIPCILFLCICISMSPGFLHADIEIYAGFKPELYGAALDRTEVRHYPLELFCRSGTADAPPEGILTVVTFNGSVRADLLELLSLEEKIIDTRFSLSKTNISGHDVFYLTYTPSGLDIAFSLEKPTSRIYDVIDRIYVDRPDAAREVKKHYSDNYLVRIHRAENIIRPDRDILEFEEALVSATVIGESFQHLWGVHDGNDLLGNIGYLVLEESYHRPVGVQYRPEREGWEELNRFLNKIIDMAGDPVANLYKLTAAAFHIEEFDEEIISPEEFVRTMEGDTLDLACFYYDILRRLNMEVKLLCIQTGEGVKVKTGAVVFRQDREWRFMDVEGIRPVSTPAWNRLPAIAFGETVSYIELDIRNILESGRYPVPPEGDWNLSVY